MLTKCTFDSPIGPLTLVASESHLVGLLFENDENRFESASSVSSSRSFILSLAETQLTEYFSGNRKTFEIPFELVGTDFQKKAWLGLLQIPYAQTLSYQEQSERIGHPKAVRAVGSANGQNPISIILPCHRVIGKNGSLTGYGGGLEAKKWLLDFESSAQNFCRA